MSALRRPCPGGAGRHRGAGARAGAPAGKAGVRAAVLAVAALLATACASGAGAATPADPVAMVQVDSRLHDMLPAAVRARGELRVVTDASYPPAESFAPDGRTITGFEPDLGAAIGKVLGVKVTFRNEDFSALPGLVADGSADMIMSAMTDTAPRRQRLDFVDYFSTGTSILVQRSNPYTVSDLGSLCGLTVAVEAGTIQQDLLARQQARCEKPMTVLDRPTNDDALVLLRTGRAVAVLMDYPPAEWLTTDPHTSAQYQLATTTQFEPGLYGIGFAKNATALRQAVRDALAELLANGVYGQVLGKWNVTQGAVNTVTVNAGAAS